MTKIRRVRKHNIDPARYRFYRRAIRIALLGNVTLAAVKGGTAWFSGSTAVMATAVDSLTDLVYTLFMAWGLRLSQQPADETHPQGHARIEPVISAVIGLMMGLAGLEVIKRAMAQLLGEPASFEWGWPAAVLIGSGLVKAIMYLLVRRLGQAARSPAICASARDNLSDVFSSAAALIGVLAANWLHPLADPIAGIIVALWIFRNVLDILLENVGYLTGRAAEPALLEQIQAAARAVDAGLDPNRVRRLVSEAKKLATESAWEVVNHSMQILGGIGYTDIYPVERMLRDVRLITIWTGTNEIMNLVIQHELYREFLAQGPMGRDLEPDAPAADAGEEKVYNEPESGTTRPGE